MTISVASILRSPIPQRKVLIVGVESAIGSALEKKLTNNGCQVTGSTRRQYQTVSERVYLDLQDSRTFIKLDLQNYDTVVLCGAVTSLHTCEKYPLIARSINVDGTIALSKVFEGSGAHLIFISTNMVFDGSRSYFGAEDKKTPITEYGRQKADVEDWLLSRNCSAAIIRFGKVLPPSFNLFAQWHHQLLAGKKITPYSNKVMAPLSLGIAVEILCLLIAARKSGIFQATACSDITYLDAALHLVRLWKANLNLVDAIISPCQGLSCMEHDGVKQYGTLQISPCFDHLLRNLSPKAAIEYAMPDQSSFNT